ncbi:MAG: transcription factor S [archaeon]
MFLLDNALMEFCEKCGGMILEKEGKVSCAGCGFKIKKKLKIKSSEKIGRKSGIAVIKKETNVNPIVDMKCPKCKNKKSYFWTMQTRASDESETKFYKCTKCEHTWRAYR